MEVVKLATLAVTTLTSLSLMATSSGGTTPLGEAAAVPAIQSVAVASGTALEQGVLEQHVANLLAASYSTAPADVTLAPRASAGTTTLQGGKTSSQAVSLAVSGTPMTPSGREDVVAAIAENQRVSKSPGVPGLPMPEYSSTRVTPDSATLAVDASTGTRTLSAETLVERTDENGVETQELIPTESKFTPQGALESFEVLDVDDLYQKELEDPESIASQEDNSPESSSATGEPLDVDAGITTGSGPIGGGGSGDHPYEDTPVAQAAFFSGSTQATLAYMTTSQRLAARDYALKYALRGNSFYRVHSSDCTNFVSQAMRFGDWKYVGTGYGRTDNTKWWYGGVFETYTWSGAENFYKFTREHSKRGKVITNLANVREGDVIQVKYWDAKANRLHNAIGHTMIVTKKTGSSMSSIYVSYHSRNTVNKRLSEFMNSMDREIYFAHGI